MTHNFDNTCSRFTLIGSTLACLLLAGCQPEPRPRPRTQTKDEPAQEHLLKGIDYLNRLDELEYSIALGQAKYSFDRWLGEHEPDPQWQPDPMTKRGSRDVRESGILNDLGDWALTFGDMQAVQEAVWLRDISRWVSQKQPNTRLQAWLDEPADRLSELEVEELLIAERLFDWTIRNIQLDRTLAYPEQTVAPGTGDASTAQRRVPPPQQGIPGPGYQFPPRETLLYGHGDILQRSRVFIELGRQQGLDIVFLAFPGRAVPPRPKPWLTAAAIGNELFLFDCELGLPIPGPDGIGIATLTQVLTDPEVLDILDSSERDYGPTPEELKEILALIDAAPSTLSQRMKLVEENLAAEQRTILTVAPSAIADRVKKMEGISDAVLWSVPFETLWFQAELPKLVAASPENTWQYQQAFGVFQGHGALVQARHLHFRGSFEERGDLPGAKTLYMRCRLPNTALNELESSPEVQKRLGMRQGEREGDFMWKDRLARTKFFQTQAKQHASYWLGLVQFDDGNLEAAAAWFKDRTLELSPNGPWTAGARYNLARTYEALGDYQQARELYLEDDSPQQHGNLIRAKLLTRETAD
ncbi:MAG: hypothetical protein CMJ64_05120 [Planctomycetaceae bacterium]|nr:hypothetical protein [Planctomycetaceae bacterium]